MTRSILHEARAPDVYQQALAGGSPGFARMANAALLAAEADPADQLEGLTIAALFTRISAEADDMQPAEGHGLVVHGEVMLMREKYDRDHGRDDQAAVAGACAMRAFTRAADLGNEVAAARLIEIAPRLLSAAITMAKGWETKDGAAEQGVYDAALRDAARGDPNALATIIGEAMVDRHSGILSPIESLAIIEQCGRLGAAAGHLPLAVHLCHALEARSFYERDNGRQAVATNKQAEQILLISVLARSGHPEAYEALNIALAHAPMKSVALAARGAPSILSFLPSEGAA